MTLEPRMLAVEERLRRMAEQLPTPDVEAGWAALSASLEPPLAKVIPLRRRSLGRPVALAAAALLVAGSALAAVTHRTGQAQHLAPAPSSIGYVHVGPHLHEAFAGPGTSGLADRPSTKPARGSTDPSGTTTAPSGTSADGIGGTGGAGHTKPQDDPNDRDQGVGNDGQHNDHGVGNNGPEGSAPKPSGGGSDHAPNGH
jgi:hypothetical protein